jgi:uncharacterized protein (UPF0261 family)
MGSGPFLHGVAEGGDERLREGGVVDGGLDLDEASVRREGPVRFLLPLGGVSAIDVPGMPFHDPEADAALFVPARRRGRRRRAPARRRGR